MLNHVPLLTANFSRLWNQNNELKDSTTLQIWGELRSWRRNRKPLSHHTQVLLKKKKVSIGNLKYWWVQLWQNYIFKHSMSDWILNLIIIPEQEPYYSCSGWPQCRISWLCMESELIKFSGSDSVLETKPQLIAFSAAQTRRIVLWVSSFN